MKKCSKCKIDKDFTEFPKNRAQPSDFHNQCLLCNRDGAKTRKRKERMAFVEKQGKIKRLEGETFVSVIRDGVEYEYLVSDFGRIISLKLGFEVLVNPSQEPGRRGRPGYLSTALRDPSKTKYYNSRVHRLVAKAFIPNLDNLPQINHIDGDKTNNYKTNLEWCTSEHNIRHSFSEKLNIAPKGKDSHFFDKGRKVKLNGVIYNSVAGASRSTGIPRTSLSGELIGNSKPKYGICYVD